MEALGRDTAERQVTGLALEQTFIRGEYKSSAEAVPAWHLHWPAFDAKTVTTMVIYSVSKAEPDPLREQRIAIFEALNLP